MTETTTPAPRFTDAYIAANRIEFNDVDFQDGVDGADPNGYPFVLIDVRPGTCACGCDAKVTSAKRNFLPGHDQRLMGILVRAARENLEVSWNVGGMTITGSSAMDYAETVLNEAGQAKLAGYLANTPKRARKESAKRWETDPSKNQDETPIGPMKIDDVKVGRWTYPARRLQDGTVVRNEKRDGSGAWVTV